MLFLAWLLAVRILILKMFEVRSRAGSIHLFGPMAVDDVFGWHIAKRHPQSQYTIFQDRVPLPFGALGFRDLTTV